MVAEVLAALVNGRPGEVQERAEKARPRKVNYFGLWFHLIQKHLSRGPSLLRRPPLLHCRSAQPRDYFLTQSDGR